MRLVANAPTQVTRHLAGKPKSSSNFRPANQPMARVDSGTALSSMEQEHPGVSAFDSGSRLLPWQGCRRSLIDVCGLVHGGLGHLHQQTICSTSKPTGVIPPNDCAHLPAVIAALGGRGGGAAAVDCGLLLSAAISPMCATALTFYAGFAVAYSFHLKKRPLVDVFVLAFLFTIRVVAAALPAAIR